LSVSNQYDKSERVGPIWTPTIMSLESGNWVRCIRRTPPPMKDAKIISVNRDPLAAKKLQQKIPDDVLKEFFFSSA
jgi:hypothetical protein